MFNPLKSRRAKAAVAGAVLALGTVALLGGSPSPAGADPQQYNGLIGMGSDTIQDVTNGYAGYSNGNNFTPLQSSAATGQRQIVSLNAIDPTGSGSLCVIPKPGAAAVFRPNGSGEGRKALAQANGFNGTGYGPPINNPAPPPATLPNPCGIKDYGGLVDFARSSSGPAAGDAGTDTTYIPMGRDAVGVAVYRAAGSPVTAFTSGQLQSIFSTGPQVISGVTVVGCSIQEGSGTRTFWLGAVSGGNSTNETTATATCRGASTTFDQPGTSPGRIEENNPVALKAKGDALQATTPGVEVVIGFSAAGFTARSNGFAAISGGGAFPSTVTMGSIDGVASVTGSAPNVAPNPAFYSNTTYGRDVYYVLPTSIIANPGNNDIKTMFVGPSAAICTAAAQTTERLFGFETNTVGACGSTTLKGSWITGNTL